MKYKIEWSRQAEKDAVEIERAGLKDKVKKMQGVLRRNPYERTPGHRLEELKGNLKGMFSRRINRPNRLVYSIFPNTENLKDPKTGELYTGIVVIDSMWGHP
jgi:Txe/YoeB family toxin of toxin-antitoxin system